MCRKLPEDPDEPHYRERADVLDEFHASGLHSITTDTNQPEAARHSSYFGGDASRVAVAGRLAGDKQDVTHAPELPLAYAVPADPFRSHERSGGQPQVLHDRRYQSRPPAPFPESPRRSSQARDGVRRPQAHR